MIKMQRQCQILTNQNKTIQIRILVYGHKSREITTKSISMKFYFLNRIQFKALLFLSIQRRTIYTILIILDKNPWIEIKHSTLITILVFLSLKNYRELGMKRLCTLIWVEFRIRPTSLIWKRISTLQMLLLPEKSILQFQIN